MTSRAFIVLALAVASGLIPDRGVRSGDDATTGTIPLPPANGELDYQLGGASPPAPDVEIVVRDRKDPPAPGRYNICYVNGFQTQPDEAELWLDDHPDLILRDEAGTPLHDPAWPDEMILDISTPTRRAKLAEIVGAWIDGCASNGFDAVELDNLDTFARFPTRLTASDAVDFARRLTDRAHAAGLAAGQKNAAELVTERDRTGFDFAVVEQCAEFDACDQFVAAYGAEVLVIEYDAAAFERACAGFPELSIVRRDLELSTPDSPGYVRESC